MNVETKLRDFMSKHKSFVMNDVYYMRGWIDGKNLCLMRDWFDVLYKTICLSDVSNVSVSAGAIRDLCPAVTTFPLRSTVATAGLLLVHVTV